MSVSTSVCTKLPRDRRPAVRDQIRLDEARRRILPVGEGPHRDAPPDRRRRCAPPASARAIVLRIPQRAVDRRRAHRQQTPLRTSGASCKVAVSLHRLDQHRQQRPQPLAADPVGRLPDHDQRLAHRFVVDAALRPRPRRIGRSHRRAAAASRACGGNPVTATNSSRIRVFSAAPAPRIPVRHRRHQLVTRRHAHPPHPAPRRRPPQGSISDEATASTSREHFRRGNAQLTPDCRATDASAGPRNRRARGTPGPLSVAIRCPALWAEQHHAWAVVP